MGERTVKDSNGQPTTTIDEPSFIVRFADQDMDDELFGGYGAEEAARKYFEMRRAAWTVSLFKEIARG